MSVAATRNLMCTLCGRKWREPVRPGARPLACPQCAPEQAERRKLERTRKATRDNAKREQAHSLHYLQPELRQAVMGAVEAAEQLTEAPGRSELALATRGVASAVGHIELREALMNLSGVAAAWASSLPTTQSTVEELHKQRGVAA